MLGKNNRNRTRIDALLVERGLAPTREKAQALIMAGSVYVGTERVDKPGKAVPADADLRVKEQLPFVSRGGVKLAGCFDHFHIDPSGLVAVDVGSSTGGFTDCLLKRGASKVYAIDVGKGLIDSSLRNDPRVVLLEERNIRRLDPSELPEKADLAVIDVSFISLKLVLPTVTKLLKPGAILLALIKPQFEAGREKVGKGGIVKDPNVHEAVVAEIRAYAETIGLKPHGTTESPITGTKGNKEFWLYASEDL